ncbi:DinB family protein [uncultured Desulfovibrio sp.]|uniref:DinB family protein n=1 Tax=uncultured Desulfovibrio sp. TaxID=167968 RepID=UPI002637268E|nr:DinB family protein [uncultured Desulfovibrio sp.]
MSRTATLSAAAPFAHAWGLLEAYLDACPDAVWAEKNGGWPVWQQFLHAAMVPDFFTRGEQDPLPAPAAPDVLMLSAQGRDVADKAAVRAYMAAVKARVDAWLERLDDAGLNAKDERLSAALGFAVDAMWIVVMLSAHTQYHLGSCDAALRDHGLPGVF